MRKTYILDTNVLLHDPEALDRFEDNNLVLPIVVLEELDKFKKDMTSQGRNARYVNRRLDELRTNGGSLATGVVLHNGGTLKVDLALHGIAGLDMEVNDNRILACAKGNSATLVSKDINLRVKADAAGVPAEDYKNDKVDSTEDLYSGASELFVPQDLVASVAKEPTNFTNEDLYENQFVTMRNSSDPQNTLLARYKGGMLHKVSAKSAEGISARNREQQLALDLLLDPAIKLVTLVGHAGTGKTLLALAAGLGQIDGKEYKRLLVSRPVVSMGEAMGFLPGDIEEKLAPWMLPIQDNVEQIMRYGDGSDDIEEKRVGRRKNKAADGPKLSAMDELKMQGILEVNPLTYIRGRSIPKQFMIVDEAQNLTPHEIKTIITRAGEGTKIILTGDPYQIDTPYLDVYSNGLIYAVDRFKGQSIYGHVHLTKGERSPLAELASELL